MSVVTRYLDINSQNRDRTQYDNPSQFQLQFDSRGSRDAETAFDPVCDSAPILRIVTSFNLVGPSNILTGTYVTTTGSFAATSAGTTITCSFTVATNSPVLTDNFYAGAVINVSGATIARRRILESYYISGPTAGVTKMVFKIESSLPDSVVADSSITINNPTDNNGNYAHVFIPTGVDIDNFYINWTFSIVHTLDIIIATFFEQSNLIISYDGATRIATLNGIMGTEYDSIGNEIILRKSPFAEEGLVFVVDSAYNPSPPNIEIYNSTYANTISRAFLTTTSQSAIVGAWVRFVCASGAPSFPSIPDDYTRKILSSSLVTVKLDSSTSTQKRMITFDSLPCVPTGLTTFQIMPFSYDNFNTISYSGNLIMFSEIACYEIKLINIILPNTMNLLNGHGGKFSTYPFIWVEFSGLETEIRNSIWSNARKAPTALFKVPMKDVNHPDSAKFIKLDGAGMSQFIPFKPIDTFSFTVKLPDGTIPLMGTDNFSPKHPNEMIQISATFEFRKRT